MEPVTRGRFRLRKESLMLLFRYICARIFGLNGAANCLDNCPDGGTCNLKHSFFRACADKDVMQYLSQVEDHLPIAYVTPLVVRIIL